MRDVIYYVASTLDGFIAHDDGSLDGFPRDEQFGAELFAAFPETFPAHLQPTDAPPPEGKWFDTVLMGRRTYEVGLREGITNPYPTLKQYVFSRTMRQSPDEQIVLVSKNAPEVVRALKREPGKAIWLCGGADLAATLFRAGLVDKLIIKLNPVVFGSGIGLFNGQLPPPVLKLTDSEVFQSGHVLLHYVVE